MGKRHRYTAVCGMAIVLSGAVVAGSGHEPALIEAVRNADAAAVRALLQQRVDVSAAALDGATALHWAVHRDDPALVDRLLRAGASAKATNRYGVTPLAL